MITGPGIRHHDIDGGGDEIGPLHDRRIADPTASAMMRFERPDRRADMAGRACHTADRVTHCNGKIAPVHLLDCLIPDDRPATTDGGSSPMRRRTLRLAGHFAHGHVEVAGDFTAWAPIEMALGADGFFSLVVEMPRDARWRYQFRVDHDIWINDPEADDYQHAAPAGATSVLYT